MLDYRNIVIPNLQVQIPATLLVQEPNLIVSIGKISSAEASNYIL